MARFYALGCLDCGVKRWVGHSSKDGTGGHLYTSDDIQIWSFLRAHQGHHLIFNDDQVLRLKDLTDGDMTAEDKAIRLVGGGL